MRRRWVIQTVIVGFIVSLNAAAQSPRVMQGPMIGAVEHDQVLLWARLSGPFAVQVELSKDSDFTDANRSAVLTASKSDDYCISIPVDGLEPDTEYFYRVLVDGKLDRYWRDRPPARLTTAPDGPAAFRLAMGSCARFSMDRVQPIWNVVAASEPDLFVWLGDNIYGDAMDSDILADEYKRQRDLASFQTLLHTVPQLAVWDDHDFGLNDFAGDHPTKAEALKVFKQYWPNGSYGTQETPGVFFKYSYGGVDFFMLDCRYHRTPNNATDGPGKTMLGTEQLEWLKDGLRQSDAPFKVIVCGSGWTLQKGPAGDSWSAFRHERDALFASLIEDKITGVVLVSGDTHLGELNVIRLSERGGYDFFELVSSPLAQVPNKKDRPMVENEERVYPGYRLTPNFGIVDFDMTESDPVLRFNISDVYGQLVWEPFEIRASQLTFE